MNDIRRSTSVEIIVSTEQITPEWMNSILAASGFDATVTDVKVRPIATGYYGTSCLLYLTYAKVNDSVPQSFFLKMATGDEDSRAGAAESGMYRFEVNFYQQLAPWVKVSTPRCYYADIADCNSKFLLLLEDMTPFEAADQLVGCSIEESRVAVSEMAGLHGSTWQAKGLENCDWARTDPAAIDSYAQGLVDLAPAFKERFQKELSQQQLDILDHLVDRAFAYWQYSFDCDNQACTHCDFRADNLLFGERDGQLRVAAVDWGSQIAGSGRDVAHFLGTCLKPGLRKQYEQELVELYHTRLVSHGVTGFNLHQCIDDYRINLFYPAYVAVVSSARVRHDERSHHLFLSMFSNAAAAIADSNSQELLSAL